MRTLLTIGLLGAVAAAAAGVERFPTPDFDTGYEPPSPTRPQPRRTAIEVVDVVVLAAALAVASWLILRTRSRGWVFVVMLGALAYFGFYRKGCVCSIGAVQNVSLSLGNGYAIPLVVVAFFLLPLVFTLLFGRTFCAAVCPLGAIQDAVLLRPLRIPAPVEHALGMLPYVYLGAAVLFAATGAAFVICQYDPFVSVFRLSGNRAMLILGGCVLLIAVFVGRPYCRYLCPYGAVLRHLSRLSSRHATITPDECIQCRLCEDACPFGAIRAPTPEPVHGDRSRGKAVLGLALLLVPVLIAGGAGLGWLVRRPLARVHPTVRQAERVRLEKAGLVEGTTDASDAFRQTERPAEELYAEARGLIDRFAIGGAVLGGFLGLVFGLKLVDVSIRRTRTDYEIDRAKCVSCARCFRYCPREHLRIERGGGERPEAET